MLENIHPFEDVSSVARRKKQAFEFKTVPKAMLDEELSNGWLLVKRNKKSVRLKKKKSVSTNFEDRIWTIFHKMQFDYLSGEGGARLNTNSDNPKNPHNQIDVAAIDNEVAVVVECKSSEKKGTKRSFQNAISKFALMRKNILDSIKQQYAVDHKRKTMLVLWTWNLSLSDADIERARSNKIILLNENDLNYYDQLVGHIGPAAKYQLLSDLLPGHRIPGLEIEVPALQTKMGKYTCYNFSITPEYLLKIGYVSHRAKGKATDIDTYQRMVQKTRLKKIRSYIDDVGVFPTNIVVNLTGGRQLDFEPRKSKGDPQGAVYGKLTLSPSYKSAWIIDGQHRLFAYSGHDRASKSYLNVLAFKDLPASKQAKFFIDINHEQKSVKRNLLHELFAELNWDAKDEETRVGAIISKAIQNLDRDLTSPFLDRILLSDDKRTSQRCISLESLFKAISQPHMLITKKKVEYGPLWTGDNDKTLTRILIIINGWFKYICNYAQEWWDLGADEGGGLAMNDGVTICIGVLRNVLQHLAKSHKLLQLADRELLELLKPYGNELGQYLGSLSSNERREFRAGVRGVQGQTAGRRQCEIAIHEKFPEFQPPGLVEFITAQDSEFNERGYSIIQRIEKVLNEIVVSTLVEMHDEGDKWWYEGVPQKVRLKIDARRDADRGLFDRRTYFDIIDYRDIVKQNWELFRDSLGYGEGSGRDKRTGWFVGLNQIRKIVAHPTGRVINQEQLELLMAFESWLCKEPEACEEENNQGQSLTT